ncbi:hypothetical protein Tco_0307068, partial [Tanacetum coccineum]
MESEFIMLDKCGEEAEWLRQFVEDIPRWPKPVTAISIHCDSKSAMGRAKSTMYNGKSRHIRRRHNSIRQLLSTGVISIDCVKSKDNIADPLTKGLSRELVNKSSKGIGLKPLKEGVSMKENLTQFTGDPKILDEITYVREKWGRFKGNCGWCNSQELLQNQASVHDHNDHNYEDLTRARMSGPAVSTALERYVTLAKQNVCLLPLPHSVCSLVLNFLMVFYNVICASKEDGGPNLDTLDYISEDVDIRNLDWCTFVWDCLKDTKKPKTYYCGSVTLLMLIYLYCTKCDEKIYHDLNVIDVGTGADANREVQEIDADMFEDIDDPTAKKTNDEDQVVEETVVVLPYKLINKLNKLLCCC